MAMCFVIQPFDSGGEFDRRYRETFKPAIESAGLEIYRVDEDPTVEVPIDDIEGKIAEAAICLADISTDNPNVWYELGYAFALNKRVVLVCSDKREGNFPFDIRHRQIIRYATSSPSDFVALEKEIERRAQALLQTKDRGGAGKPMAEGDVSDRTYLQLLRIAAELMPIPGDSISVRDLKANADRTGVDSIDFGLAIRRLEKDGFMERHRAYYENGEYYEPIELTDAGWNWIYENKRLFSPER